MEALTLDEDSFDWRTRASHFRNKWAIWNYRDRFLPVATKEVSTDTVTLSLPDRK